MVDGGLGKEVSCDKTSECDYEAIDKPKDS